METTSNSEAANLLITTIAIQTNLKAMLEETKSCNIFTLMGSNAFEIYCDAAMEFKAQNSGVISLQQAEQLITEVVAAAQDIIDKIGTKILVMDPSTC